MCSVLAYIKWVAFLRGERPIVVGMVACVMWVEVGSMFTWEVCYVGSMLL